MVAEEEFAIELSRSRGVAITSERDAPAARRGSRGTSDLIAEVVVGQRAAFVEELTCLRMDVLAGWRRLGVVQSPRRAARWRRPRARSESVGFRFRPHGLRIRQVMVQAQRDMGSSSLDGASQGSGGARTGQYPAHHGIGGMDDQPGDDFNAFTIGYGVNNTDRGAGHAAFAEGTRHFGVTSMFARAELVQVETELLLHGQPDSAATVTRNTVGAFTVGGVRDLWAPRGFEAGIGRDVTFYAVPDNLKATYGWRPMSFQVFVRVRPPSGPMGRIWNMRMSAPMRHAMPHE